MCILCEYCSSNGHMSFMFVWHFVIFSHMMVAFFGGISLHKIKQKVAKDVNMCDHILFKVKLICILCDHCSSNDRMNFMFMWRFIIRNDNGRVWGGAGYPILEPDIKKISSLPQYPTGILSELKFSKNPTLNLKPNSDLKTRNICQKF